MNQRTKIDATRAARAIKDCDFQKYSPSLMDEEQSALCYRVWAEEARQKLRR